MTADHPPPSRSNNSGYNPGYIGRFAPSPSGPLHFGSLVAALASYLDARAAGGRWLVRMEDLDPPREMPGAAGMILDSLQAHALEWDGEVLFQSSRHPAYADALQRLTQAQLTYPCTCTRKAIAAQGGIYPGTCRHKPPNTTAPDQPAAIRLKVSDLPAPFTALEQTIVFVDQVFGRRTCTLGSEAGDFILRRKDGLFAYQLAVVVDDLWQGITHVIRGSDLLDITPQQLFLFQLLAAMTPDNPSPPAYGHCPVVLNQQGQKLSKQHGAEPLDDSRAADNLFRALHFLQQAPPDSLRGSAPRDILDWGIAHWTPGRLPATAGFEED